ncbi:hypothetical protein BH10PLA1_BH10PLA1_17910 [soil metagenome]
MEPTAAPNPPVEPPPRAFTQGVGTVYQFTGVLLFLSMMAVCCASGLMSMETAKRDDLVRIGWHLPLPGSPLYSAQKAISVSLTLAVGWGVALATIGLGLQGQRRHSPTAAIIASGAGVLCWLYHAAFFAIVLKSVGLTLVCLILLLIFVGLFALAIAAWREMRRDPPPANLTILPPGYKIPYSHMHEDSPEVRYAAEMEQRRQRLEVQKKELEAMEERIKNNKYKRGEQ